MATCNTNSLLAQAGCFSCLAMDQLQLVNTALLCQILQATNPMASCDVSTLLASARCFEGCTTPAQLMLIQTQLLCEILALSGGDTGGSGVGCGVVDPVAAPAGGCGIYYRTDTGSVWIWDGAAWVLRIA